MAELRLATIRIVSNYVRLAATVCLGVYLVRVLLATVGEEGMGLVLLLGATVSIAQIIEEAASWSMIRELGAAHHSGDVSQFRRMFNSALALSALASVGILVLFGIILLLVPLLNVSSGLMAAARWFVIAKGIEVAILVLFSPQFNMYLITERMVAYNFWLVARRATAVIAAVSLFWLNAGGDPARGLIIFAWLSSGLMALTVIVSAVLITLEDKRLIPAIGTATRSGINAIVGLSGWNFAIQSSQLLGLPAGQIIMNYEFGLARGNMPFGVAVTLAGYARMVASGMTMGLDAVATRMSAATNGDGMRNLLRYSTLLHGLAAFPAVIGIGLLAYPLLQVWVGSKLNDPAVTLPITASIARVLLVGFGIMVICDCWTRIMYGAGHVRRYARIAIVANLLTPVLAMTLILITPESIRHTAVAWAFSLIYIVFYLGFIPVRTARSLNVSYLEVIQPLFKPLIAAMVCAPVLLVFLMRVSSWNLLLVLIAAMTYAACYCLLAWVFVLTGPERTRLLTAASRFMPGRRLTASQKDALSG